VLDARRVAGRKCCRPTFTKFRALLTSDRRDVGAELLGESGNNVIGSRVRCGGQRRQANRLPAHAPDQRGQSAAAGR